VRAADVDRGQEHPALGAGVEDALRPQGRPVPHQHQLEVRRTGLVHAHVQVDAPVAR
jgi:hypothetical protein